MQGHDGAGGGGRDSGDLVRFSGCAGWAGGGGSGLPVWFKGPKNGNRVSGPNIRTDVPKPYSNH